MSQALDGESALAILHSRLSDALRFATTTGRQQERQRESDPFQAGRGPRRGTAINRGLLPIRVSGVQATPCIQGDA